MKARKFISILLACLMLASIASACSSGTPDPTLPPEQTQVPDNSVPSADTAAPAGNGNDPYTFTYYANYDWYDASRKWGNDTASSTMLDMFNTTVVLSMPDIDPDQKMGVMVSTDDLPECMMIERDSLYQQLIDLDMLLPLDEYLPGSKYAEQVDERTINMSRVNGKVYGLLNFSTNTPTGNNGWAINKKIWEQLGSPALNTTDDLYNYLIAVRDSGITVDGKSVIPLQFVATSSEFEIVSQMMASFGVRRIEGVTDIGGELKLYYNAPGAVEAFKYLNKLWNDGLINSDHFVEKPEQVTEKTSTGRVAVYCGNDITGEFGQNARRVMKENDPDNDYIVIEPPAAPGVKQSEIWNSYYYSLGWNVIVITKKAEHPERIFEVLDYIHSDEGTLLTTFGPQGVLWDELDADGYPILNKNVSDLTQEEKDNLGVDDSWWLLGNAPYMDKAKIADNNRKPADQRDWVTDAQVNVLWNHSMYADAFIGTPTDPQSPEGIAFTTFQQLDEQYIPRIIMSKDEAECVSNIEEAKSKIYSQGFESTEKFKTGVYQENLKILGQ